MEKEILDYLEEILNSEASDMLTGYQKQAIDAIAELLSYTDYERLCELSIADRSGRCKILPVPLGSDIWVIKFPEKVDEDGTVWTLCSYDKAKVGKYERGFNLHMLPMIGETYFISEEDATNKLNELRGKRIRDVWKS